MHTGRLTLIYQELDQYNSFFQRELIYSSSHSKLDKRSENELESRCRELENSLTQEIPKLSENEKFEILPRLFVFDKAPTPIYKLGKDTQMEAIPQTSIRCLSKSLLDHFQAVPSDVEMTFTPAANSSPFFDFKYKNRANIASFEEMDNSSQCRGKPRTKFCAVFNTSGDKKNLCFSAKPKEKDSRNKTIHSLEFSFSVRLINGCVGLHPIQIQLSVPVVVLTNRAQTPDCQLFLLWYFMSQWTNQSAMNSGSWKESQFTVSQLMDFITLMFKEYAKFECRKEEIKYLHRNVQIDDSTTKVTLEQFGKNKLYHEDVNMTGQFEYVLALVNGSDVPVNDVIPSYWRFVLSICNTLAVSLKYLTKFIWLGSKDDIGQALAGCADGSFIIRFSTNALDGSKTALCKSLINISFYCSKASDPVCHCGSKFVDELKTSTTLWEICRDSYTRHSGQPFLIKPAGHQVICRDGTAVSFQNLPSSENRYLCRPGYKKPSIIHIVDGAESESTTPFRQTVDDSTGHQGAADYDPDIRPTDSQAAYVYQPNAAATFPLNYNNDYVGQQGTMHYGGCQNQVDDFQFNASGDAATALRFGNVTLETSAYDYDSDMLPSSGDTSQPSSLEQDCEDAIRLFNGSAYYNNQSSPGTAVVPHHTGYLHPVNSPNNAFLALNNGPGDKRTRTSKLIYENCAIDDGFENIRRDDLVKVSDAEMLAYTSALFK